MFQLHNDMIGPYLDRLCTPEQRERWLPGYCSGELIAAIAMTEPGAGSDLQGIRSTAVRDGDHYMLNGQKTFISNGQLGDIVIVVARTDPAAGHRGISLLMVERDMPGFTRGRNLDKLGMHAQDTSELFFTDVRVPAANLLGEEGGGFVALMQNLPRERVTIGVTALAIAEQAFADTLAYCKERSAFGQPIGNFQHSKFLLAEMATEIAVAREFTDRAITEHCADRLSTEEASMVKWWNTELCNRVTDRSCSFTAATATCASTRSAARGPTAASSRSSAAPPRSRRKSSPAASACSVTRSSAKCSAPEGSANRRLSLRSCRPRHIKNMRSSGTFSARRRILRRPAWICSR